MSRDLGHAIEFNYRQPPALLVFGNFFRVSLCTGGKSHGIVLLFPVSRHHFQEREHQPQVIEDCCFIAADQLPEGRRIETGKALSDWLQKRVPPLPIVSGAFMWNKGKDGEQTGRPA